MRSNLGQGHSPARPSRYLSAILPVISWPFCPQVSKREGIKAVSAKATPTASNVYQVRIGPFWLRDMPKALRLGRLVCRAQRPPPEAAVGGGGNREM